METVVEAIEKIESAINLNSQWKNSLKCIYQLGTLSVTAGNDNNAVNFMFKNGSNLGTKLNFFKASHEVGSGDYPYSGLSESQSLIFFTQERISRLIELKLITSRESGRYTAVDGDLVHGAPIYEYTLNDKGLEVVLKLIEHEDSEKRFDVQTSINERLKRNSNISLLLSSVFLVIAIAGLKFSYERLIMTERRLEIIEQAVIRPVVPQASKVK